MRSRPCTLSQGRTAGLWAIRTSLLLLMLYAGATAAVAGAAPVAGEAAEAGAAPEAGAASAAGTAGKGDDLYRRFKDPPAGYGEVAFYWWLGDTLTHERILWQLDQLAGKGVTGLQVNYAHTDSGGISYGLTYQSRPKLFSEQWWELFGWFMNEAKKRGMAVSLSDYTLGVGQGWCVDEALAEHPDLAGSELRFAKRVVAGGAVVEWQLPGEPLSITAFKAGADSLPAGRAVDLTRYASGRSLHWTPPDDGRWLIAAVWAERVLPSYDPMHPLAGSAYISKFYGRFAERFPGEAGRGINFFFSDELSFRLQYPIWDNGFAREFSRRKGYDVRPHLAALFLDAGAETPRIRLDYNDVMVSLSEEHFFRPLYEWHQQHGMTFGCDHGGRGLDVAEFGDYFRTQKWNQGPGCDQPMLQQNIIKNKVASSIAHLYKRPRVWLEGFHSSGWGTTSAQVADAVYGNFVMGQNLLSFHGFYYSTHGGWWEWAPPCNHFREPYYRQMGPFMHEVQRLSYLLSQGTHRCDVAILYPVGPVIAGTAGGEAVKAAFEAGAALYNAGIDFDFIDYQSLARAEVQRGRIRVADEEYRVLVIPSMRTIRFASLTKARDLAVSGGTVVNLGAIPGASERGRGEKGFEAVRSALFGRSAGDTALMRRSLAMVSPARRMGAVYECNNNDSLISLVSRLFPRDFAIVSSRDPVHVLPRPSRPPRVMHRRIDGKEIYALYNVPAGTDCFFRSKGKAALWDPATGAQRPLYQVRTMGDGMVVKLPLTEHEVQLVVFSPGRSDALIEASTLSGVDTVAVVDGMPVVWGSSASAGKHDATLLYNGKQVRLSGEATFGRVSRPITGAWEFQVEPVLDNRWGDFHWPPTQALIGPEARRLGYREGQRGGTSQPAHNDTVSCSFGAQFWKLGPLPAMLPADSLVKGGMIDPRAPVRLDGRSYCWSPYQFSWRWGVEDDPGHQGYHGLKEEVHPEFIRLGKPVVPWPGVPAIDRQPEEGGLFYCLFTSVLAPVEGDYSIEQGAVLPAGIVVNGVPLDTAARSTHLRSGQNMLLLWYRNPAVTYIVFRKARLLGGGGEAMQGGTQDPGARPLAMRWYGDSTLLRYDTRFNEKAPEGWYSFVSPPGLTRIRFAAHGSVEVAVAGNRVPASAGMRRPDGATLYEVILPQAAAGPAEVVLHVAQERGCYGGAAFPDPLEMECERGTFETGDWSKNDGLFAYSGGAWYRRSVTLSKKETDQRVELDLGSVASSAEVRVNGQQAGVRVAPPWTFDISTLVHEGENSIEVLVFNSAANHYTSIPTRYRGSTVSGMLGPVLLNISERVALK